MNELTIQQLYEATAQGAKVEHKGHVVERRRVWAGGQATHVSERNTWYVDGKFISKKALFALLEVR